MKIKQVNCEMNGAVKVTDMAAGLGIALFSFGPMPIEVAGELIQHLRDTAAVFVAERVERLEPVKKNGETVQ